MKTFEIYLGKGVYEVIDLGDDSPFIHSFTKIIEGQSFLQKEIAKLGVSLSAQKAETELFRNKLHRAKEILGEHHADLSLNHQKFFQELQGLYP